MDFIKNIVVFAFGFSLFINAMLFIPQIVKIVRKKNAAGFSKITFIGFCLTQLTAIIYGCIRHDWILTGGYTLALLTCGTVTILIFVYSTGKGK